MKVKTVLFTFLFLSVLSCNSFSYSIKTDSLLLQLKSKLSDSLKVNALIDIVELNEVGKDSALLFIKEALKTTVHSKNPALISRAMHYLSHWHIGNTKNQDTILFYCRNHLEQMRKLKYMAGIANAYGNLGMAYTWHSLDSSMHYNLKSIEFYNKAEKFDNANIAKINLANVYLEIKRYAEAIDIFKETAAYGIQSGNRDAAGLSYFNMSECYTRLGDLANAEKCINKACALEDSLNYPSPYCNAMLGDLYFAQGRIDEAQALYESLLVAGKKNRSDYFLYRAYSGLAEVSFKKEKWADAVMYKKLSWNYSYKDLSNSKSLHKMIYACDSALGNYKSSLSGYQQYIAVRDSYENVERLKSADALEAKYQNKEKQSKIELLSKEKEIEIANVQRQQLIRNIIIAVCVVIAAMGLLLFNRFKLKKKIESQQAIINERKRISRELHDDLGAQLSTARMFLNKIKTNENVSDDLISNSLNLIDSSIHDLRTIMDDLHTSTLQQKGLIAATEELVNKMNNMQQVKFNLSHSAFNERFSQQIEHNLFRITQELINNTHKYAKAKHVSIDIINRDKQIVMMYEDDGVGFDTNVVKHGYGLNNIETRVKAINGTVEFDSSVGNGARTVIEIPVDYDGKKI